MSEANLRVTAAVDALIQLHPPWLVDFIPSFESLLVCFNAFAVDHHFVIKFIYSMQLSEQKIAKTQQYRIPVYYAPKDIEHDCDIVANTHNISLTDVVNLHSSVQYQVFAIGFLPNFAYLGQAPLRISTPRLSKPRAKVPKGAVAIADRQTAIYPQQSPGGWNILGICPLDYCMYKITKEPLKTGDAVSFYAIDADEYVSMLLKGEAYSKSIAR